ncbi:MAG TPA: pyruvate carboxylase, partial [Candidatus Ligilactobacillus excrementipullorum]|nr:pyruvate carboxylase [Candidatus Ligilactobacillus excrementipullorum]
QRRHQKVIEFAPSITLSAKRRAEICNAAVKLMQSVNYQNAGTVEFLVTDSDFYFIEVNPRVQVEHTVTEMITDIDIVQTQIKIADGQNLYTEIGLPRQDQLTMHGSAIQCRITTEDPENDFLPDTGKIETYRSPGGFGVRLDGGNAYAGATVTPFFDSLLVKACVQARTFEDAVKKMRRVLSEFQIRGVKTNIGFMTKVLNHPTFYTGQAHTTFIDDTKELFIPEKEPNTSNMLLKYVGNVTVNGYPGVAHHKKVYYPEARLDQQQITGKPHENAKTILKTQGADAVIKWVKDQPKLLLTDTTMRDAHQSLFATRMRTKDMRPVIDVYDRAFPDIFSAEVWGGATFEVAYRFLREDPWKRLQLMQQKMPNTLLQMLFRGSNAVGYQNYPDNVLREFITESAHQGVDVFRIFDSLNWVDQMEKSIQYARDAGKIAEGTMCYTGDLLSPSEHKYDLNYFVSLAKDLVSAGAQIIAVKDMAGLLKPNAAYELISSLKDAIDVPIHLHTHDTTGNGIATYLQATRAGVDIVDVASSALSGTTSQPSMTSLYYGLAGNERQPELDLTAAEAVNRYWSGVKPYYQDFMKTTDAAQTDIYETGMPGGQYSNLQQQAQALGISNFEEVKDMYRTVNSLLGNIIKVTPSSKVVGDLALFMLQNNLNAANILTRGEELDFPQSVVDFFAGDIGQPVGGFPPELQKVVLKGRTPLTVRPGSLAQPVDFELTKKQLATVIGREPTKLEVLSYVLYPDVFKDYDQANKQFGAVEYLDTATFYQGMRPTETTEISFGHGKSIIVKLDSISRPDDVGNRTLFFSVNGETSRIVIKDQSQAITGIAVPKAEPTNREHVGATLSGSVLELLVQNGQKVHQGDELVVTEAMKMETTIKAPFDGTIKHTYIKKGDLLETGDLLLEISPDKQQGDREMPEM